MKKKQSRQIASLYRCRVLLPFTVIRGAILLDHPVGTFIGRR